MNADDIKRYGKIMFYDKKLFAMVVKLTCALVAVIFTILAVIIWFMMKSWLLTIIMAVIAISAIYNYYKFNKIEKSIGFDMTLSEATKPYLGGTKYDPKQFADTGRIKRYK